MCATRGKRFNGLKGWNHSGRPGFYPDLIDSPKLDRPQLAPALGPFPYASRWNEFLLCAVAVCEGRKFDAEGKRPGRPAGSGRQTWRAEGHAQARAVAGATDGNSRPQPAGAAAGYFPGRGNCAPPCRGRLLAAPTHRLAQHLVWPDWDGSFQPAGPPINAACIR
jgi:hypothetical protein